MTISVVKGPLDGPKIGYYYIVPLLGEPLQRVGGA